METQTFSYAHSNKISSSEKSFESPRVSWNLKYRYGIMEEKPTNEIIQ